MKWSCDYQHPLACELFIFSTAIFLARFFAWFLIFWTISFHIRTFLLYGGPGRCEKPIAESKVKQLVLHVFSSTLVWRLSLFHCIFTSMGLRRLFLSVYVWKRCTFFAFDISNQKRWHAQLVCVWIVGIKAYFLIISFLSQFSGLRPHILMLSLYDFNSI